VDYTGAPKTLDLQSFERQRQNGHCRYEGSCLKTTIAFLQVHVCPIRLSRLVNPAAGVKRFVPTRMILNSVLFKDPWRDFDIGLWQGLLNFDLRLSILVSNMH
jgi:hypothetical protein